MVCNFNKRVFIFVLRWSNLICWFVWYKDFICFKVWVWLVDFFFLCIFLVVFKEELVLEKLDEFLEISKLLVIYIYLKLFLFKNRL